MRQTKISADISKEANTLLNDACIKHERSKGFLLEKMIRKFCSEVEAVTEVKTEKVKAPKAARKILTYPDNVDEQFLLLWDSKGKKGQKQKAYDIYRKMSAGQTNEVLEGFTLILINDINKKKHEPGYPERHLTSYLNGKFWEE